jgi:hypothetical protein
MALRPFIFVASVDKLRRYGRRVYCVDDPVSIIWRLVATLRRPAIIPIFVRWRLDEVLVTVSG